MSVRVYVAGSSDEREIVGHWLLALRKAGAVITHDWTNSEGYYRSSTEDERRRWARQDLDGVRAANVVWMLAPEGKSEGAHVELGAALALGKRVLVSGAHARRESRLFGLLAEIHGTHREAYFAIVGKEGALD
jgi:hypothetical protein